jgi:AcrR family transcriptional regulator
MTMAALSRPRRRLAPPVRTRPATRGTGRKPTPSTFSFSTTLRAGGVALRLFDERGFDEVTIEEIATEAHISVRTFYRYFSAKDDVLQLEIDRRSEGIRDALSTRPDDEPAMQSLRLAFEEVIAREDPGLLRRWIAVIQATPSVVKGVLGGIQLKTQPVISEFFAARLGLPADGLVPVILAAAVGGVIQAALTRWFFHGGDVTTTVSESLEVLERGLGVDLRTWSADVAEP